MTVNTQKVVDAPPADLIALQGLVRSIKPNPLFRPRIIEVGSWTGATAVAMATADDVEVHCVDTWEGSATDFTGTLAREYGREKLLRLFCKNADFLLFTSIYPHVGTSEFWASVWPWKADMVFLDADHSYESTLRQIMDWTPRIVPGGILCGHDFGHEDFPGVHRAVNDTGGYERCGMSIWYRRLNRAPDVAA